MRSLYGRIARNFIDARRRTPVAAAIHNTDLPCRAASRWTLIATTDGSEQALDGPIEGGNAGTSFRLVAPGNGLAAHKALITLACGRAWSPFTKEDEQILSVHDIVVVEVRGTSRARAPLAEQDEQILGVHDVIAIEVCGAVCRRAAIAGVGESSETRTLVVPFGTATERIACADFIATCLVIAMCCSIGFTAVTSFR